MATENSVMAVIRASRPNFRNPNDKIAFAVHASFLAAGYSLIAAGSRACSDNPPTDGEEVGIEGWNESEDQYGFVYLKSCKGEKTPILVKCLSIGDALVVDVLNLKENDKEPFHIQINVKDHVLNGDSSNNYGEMYKSLERLVESVNAGIFNKLEAKTGSSVSGTSSSKSGRSTNEPVFPVQRQEPPPVLRPPPVPSPGGSDLFPGPGAGVFPSRGPGIGGGMLIGPNDPRWFPGGEIPGPDFLGGDLIPPGARFDPIGPPDVPGFRPGHFVSVQLSRADDSLPLEEKVEQSAAAVGGSGRRQAPSKAYSGSVGNQHHSISLPLEEKVEVLDFGYDIQDFSSDSSVSPDRDCFWEAAYYNEAYDLKSVSGQDEDRRHTPRFSCPQEKSISLPLEEKAEECCICMSPYDDGVEQRGLPCNHHFHLDCIEKWLQINAICPLCKISITESSNHGREEV